MAELIIRDRDKSHIANAIMSGLSIPMAIFSGPQLVSDPNFFSFAGLTVVLIFAVFFSLFIYSTRKLLDRSVKLIINETGIWSKRTGWINWSDVNYFRFNEAASGVDYTLDLVIVTNSGKGAYSIEVGYFSIKPPQIAEAIRVNSGVFSIRELQA